MTYEQLEVLWTTTVFIEDGGVPSDTQVVGYTWRFVNRDGGPDRRFNNNRKIPKALYLQMGLSSPQGLRKILHFSRVIDHVGFDSAITGLRGLIRNLKLVALEGPHDAKVTSNSVTASSEFFVSDAAREIERDKSDFWEHKLTIELLRSNVGPLVKEWNQLRSDGYTKNLGSVSRDDGLRWCSDRVQEVAPMYQAFAALVNDDLRASWGPPGQPGDSEKIARVCQKLTVCAKQALQWEERIRFTTLPEQFTEMKNFLSGSAGPLLDQTARIYNEMSEIFERPNPSGNHNINLLIRLPDGWEERGTAVLGRLKQSLGIP